MNTMELTQQDYDERVARQAAGNGTDEDRRLIQHYQDQGFTGDDNSAGKRLGAPENTPTAPDSNEQAGDTETAKPAKGARGTSTSFGKQN